MARLANEFAEKEGLDAQKVLEHFLSSVAAEAAKPVQGRKNHYGSRSERGMLAAAVMYSLIETCSRLGIDTRAYFREALTRAIENPGTVYTPRCTWPPSTPDLRHLSLRFDVIRWPGGAASMYA